MAGKLKSNPAKTHNLIDITNGLEGGGSKISRGGGGEVKKIWAG